MFFLFGDFQSPFCWFLCSLIWVHFGGVIVKGITHGLLKTLFLVIFDPPTPWIMQNQSSFCQVGVFFGGALVLDPHDGVVFGTWSIRYGLSMMQIYSSQNLTPFHCVSWENDRLEVGVLWLWTFFFSVLCASTIAVGGCTLQNSSLWTHGALWLVEFIMSSSLLMFYS